jgi:hypothetical protein
LWCGDGHLHKKCPDMLQLLIVGRRKHPSRQISGLQTSEGEVPEDYNGKGVLFQPHHSRRVLRGGTPRQGRGTAAASDTSGDSGRSRHSGTQSPCGLTPT